MKAALSRSVTVSAAIGVCLLPLGGRRDGSNGELADPLLTELPLGCLPADSACGAHPMDWTYRRQQILRL